MNSDVWRQSEFEAELLYDATLACRVIQTFLNDLPNALAAIHAAFAQGQFDTLAKAVHYLHGSAAQLQLAALVQHCRTLHQQASAQSLDHSQLQQLMDAAEQAQQYLSRYLATSGYQAQ